MANYYENPNLSYPQLIFNQIKKVQEIAAKELRDGDKVIKNLIGEQLIEQEDTRLSYLQAVETLGSLLSPYFDKDTADSFKSFQEFYDIELEEALEDEEFKEKAEKILGKDVVKNLGTDKKDEVRGYAFFLQQKIICARDMFRELLLLFKNLDFLGNEEFNDVATTNGSMEAVDDSEEDIFENEEESSSA